MSPRASVIIPNWNTREFLGPCLASLRRQTFEDFETVLVDSASTDGSVGFVEENFPETKTVVLPENRGFSGAVNAGIEASRAEFVVLLNNDTEQDPGWLAALVRAADSHPGTGLFASKLVDFGDRRRLDGAGDALRQSGLPYRLGHGERDRGQFEREEYVFGACAAAALYRRSVLEEIGLFDEDFFAYCEDGDLSFRAQLAGHRCLYVPDAVVYHVGSVSTGGKRSPTATRLGTRNGLLLLVKNLPGPLLWSLLPSVVLGQLSRLLVVSLSPGGLKAHLAGLAGAWRLLPKMLKKREAIQGARRTSDAYLKELLGRSSRRAAESRRRRIRDALMARVGR
ncbi:MAG: glycosyl transferase, family 2 [uncultured Rubrobacteraceae bacterium]|uniref:Glycosyl transferase, family 2 n=1 Tax=uncultured Rubrobacteraceae bacterium TaxID=349277 RepID=A0A6J4N9U1_9ACTN|nr:MAG: glycosyl transferase, family 2 [uncultured Rubrobacteraceae bacterium]